MGWLSSTRTTNLLLLGLVVSTAWGLVPHKAPVEVQRVYVTGGAVDVQTPMEVTGSVSIDGEVAVDGAVVVNGGTLDGITQIVGVAIQ